DPEDIFLLTRDQRLFHQLHPARRANVGLEFVERRFVPDPDAVVVGILIDLVELEVREGWTTPALKEYASSGHRLSLFIDDADPHGATGLHDEVDRSHPCLDIERLHVRGPALRGNDQAGGAGLAADELVSSVGPGRRLTEVIDKLGVYPGTHD